MVSSDSSDFRCCAGFSDACEGVDEFALGSVASEKRDIRLTIADALGSTVVLDDQLVQSDASRMDWLRAFMMECADRFQILVFTCHPEEYESSGAGEDSAVKSIDLAEYLQRSL